MYPECVKLASLRHGDIYAAKHEQLKALAAHQNEKGGRNSLKKKKNEKCPTNTYKRTTIMLKI